MADVLQLAQTGRFRTPIGHVIRTGEASYRQLEHLHAKGRLPARAVVIDASKARFQLEFIRSLRASGADVTLDPKVAELSEPGKFSGSAKATPRAIEDARRPLEPDDFDPQADTDLFGKIARMSVELGVTTVLSPAHFLRPGVDNVWLPIDRRSVALLRAALDREGCAQIAIDYPLILPHIRLLDDRYLPRTLAALPGLPFDNLVLRLSGLGADARPLAVKRTAGAIEQLHVLGYPILLDYVGGLVGLGALAFGVVSGIAHGIGERDRFDARSWNKPPRPQSADGSFGRPIAIPLPGLDKSFRKKEFRAIATAARGRRLDVCGERDCCPRGLSSMLENHRAHIARQKFRAIKALFAVPDARRVDHFIDVDLRSAERLARDLVHLNLVDDGLTKSRSNWRKRIGSMTRMFETLSERTRPSPPPLKRRQGPGAPTHRSSA